MQCMSPIRVRGQLMPCGRCPACMRNKSNQWVFRMNEEMKVSNHVYFFTLSYRDEDLPMACYVPEKRVFPCVSRRDIQLFLKRLRKNLEVSFKYHIVAEYGPNTLRPHYHGMIFSQYVILQEDVLSAWQHQDLVYKTFDETFDRNAAGYCAKYLGKIPFLPDYIKNSDRIYRPFTLCSKGLGLTYLETNPQLVSKKVDQLEDFVVLDGRRQAMPRYYANKLFPIDKEGIENRESLHYQLKLRKAKLRYDIERKRYLQFCKTYKFVIDSVESIDKWNDHKKMICSDAWRQAFKKFKNKKEKL